MAMQIAFAAALLPVNQQATVQPTDRRAVCCFRFLAAGLESALPALLGSAVAEAREQEFHLPVLLCPLAAREEGEALFPFSLSAVQ